MLPPSESGYAARVKISQLRWTAGSGWQSDGAACDANLVLAFGDSPYFHSAECFTELRRRFPKASIAGCSSSGNVSGASITDEDVVVTAIQLERGSARIVAADVSSDSDPRAIANDLFQKLQGPDLRHVLVLSDGLRINGSEIAMGLRSGSTGVTGGLAGDAMRFGSTWVLADAPARQGRLALIGLYGALQVKSSYCAGWTEFGADRVVTRSSGNVVFEIDGQPALALYKRYLGEMAAGLPGSGMRFPLSIETDDAGHTLIRTLLAVDEQAQSLTFAGDVPQGSRCKLMRTNLDTLIESAETAAHEARPAGEAQGLCVVVSCAGRRVVLGQLADEELEVVQRHLGSRMKLAGFYSYGELAPLPDVPECHLHNQTMSLTTVCE